MNKVCINSNGKDIVALMNGDHKMKLEPMSQCETTCRGSSSDTTANKINPYFMIG